MIEAPFCKRVVNTSEDLKIDRTLTTRGAILFMCEAARILYVAYPLPRGFLFYSRKNILFIVKKSENNLNT